MHAYRKRFWLAVALTLSLANSNLAIHTLLADGPLHGEPSFQFLPTQGPAFEGQIQSVDANGSWVVRDQENHERTLASSDLFRLIPTEPSFLSRPPRDGRVLLAGGDSIVGRIVEAGDDNFQVRSPALGVLDFPIDQLLGFVTDGPLNDNRRESLIREIQNETRETDFIWLANGDRISGTFLEMSTGQMVFSLEQGEVRFERDQVLGLALDPNLTRPASFSRPYLEVYLADGTRISGSPAQYREGKLVLSRDQGPEILCPVDGIKRAYVLNAGAEFLAQRPVSATEYVPYVGPVLTFQTDRNALGRPLVVHSTTYPRGLGTQSRTLLAYALDPDHKRFQAQVALDDAAGPWGSVVFKVLLDGKVVQETPVVQAGDPMINLDIPVEGARFLILATEFGPRGNVQDYADWLEARLIK